MAAESDPPPDHLKPSDPERAEEPDFDDEDEAAMDRVWDRLHAGESLDDEAEDEYESED